jgi:predicted O-linked N-acetylglucosamine transferase (SPINDLY family)
LSDLREHLRRYTLADLFLDTLPFNAHTTASDALAAGLPVLTCLGQAFPGRVAASLLRAAGLPELVTSSLEEYESLAHRLATEPARLAELRARLVRNRQTHPVFDPERFRKHLEAAYVSMWQRSKQGEAPASFAVAPLP